MARLTGNSSNTTNSVDNLIRILNLFLNFSKKFIFSLPNDMILDINCPIGRIDYVQSDMSADSSFS